MCLQIELCIILRIYDHDNDVIPDHLDDDDDGDGIPDDLENSDLI